MKTTRNFISLFLTACLLIISPRAALSLPDERAAERMSLGIKLLHEGKIKEGIDKLEEARSLDGANPYITLYLARGYSWDGRYDKAKQLYRNIIDSQSKKDDVYWRARFGSAQVLSWEKQYENAIEQFTLIEKEHKSMDQGYRTDLYLALGDVHSWKQDYRTAMDYFKKILSFSPNNTEALNRAAKVSLWDRDYKGSREYTEKTLTLDKENHEALRRLQELDLIKVYTLSVENLYTLYDTENENGDRVMRNYPTFRFGWQATEKLKLLFEASAASQNTIESTDPEEANRWHTDAGIGAGASYWVGKNTNLCLTLGYAYDAHVLPDFYGELALSRKITRNFDILGSYRYTYDRRDTIQTDVRESSHLVSAGTIYYFTEHFYSHAQGYLDTDGKNRYFSIMLHQAYGFTPRDRGEIFITYGMGKNYLVYSDTTVPLDVRTYGLALSYTRFFTSSFGLKPSLGYHYRVDFYEDFTFGVEGIYQF